LGLEPGPQLRDLLRSLLTEDAEAQATAEPVPPVEPQAQLPADVSAFTGRAGVLRRLDALISSTGKPVSTPVIVSLIVGIAGVGKTALAVHWAHKIRHRFGDGQLYVNLRGHAAGPPVEPVEALGRFLRALGVPPTQIPSDVDEASALFRSRL